MAIYNQFIIIEENIIIYSAQLLLVRSSVKVIDNNTELGVMVVSSRHEWIHKNYMDNLIINRIWVLTKI